MTVANGAVAAFFSNLALVVFLSKFLLTSASKSSFFRFGVEIRVLELQIAASCVAVVHNSIAFCNSLSADRSGMVASRFLAAAAAGYNIMLCS